MKAESSEDDQTDDKTDGKQPASPEEDKVNHDSEKFIHFFCEHHQPKLQTVSS
jgi:hypothetical protein